MARLPQPGADNGTWGTILNDYLSQSLSTDGTIKPGAVTAAAVTDGTITEAKLDPAVVTKLNTVATGVSGVSSVNSKTGAVTLTKSDVGLANVDNTADASKSVASAATATTATRLATARTINGVSFDGSANITLPATADSTKVNTSTQVLTSGSLTGGGALTGNLTLSLMGDAASPGNSMYYGTNASGTKGYYAVPSGGGTPVATTTSTGTITLAGDLGGATGNSPSVLKVNGVSVPAAPSAGQVLTATSGTAAAWQTVSTVAGVTVSGTPSAGQVLKATSGTAATWQADATGGGGGGGLNFTYRNIIADTTAANNECLIVTSTPSGITITLPAPVANGLVRVKRLAPNGNSIQVAAPLGSVIDDTTVGTDTLNNQYESRDYWSNGTNWYR